MAWFRRDVVPTGGGSDRPGAAGMAAAAKAAAGKAAAAKKAAKGLPAGPAEAEDSPAMLRWNAYQLNRLINANAGKLPGEAVVAARRVTDTMREVIDTSEVRPLDIYAVVTVKGVLNDYLPTTLRSYLALDSGVVNVQRPSGHSPAQSLVEQINSLRQAGTQLLTAVRDQDADALLAQGRFLSAKFTGSDLDL
ncbi:hypothetical protein SAMN05444157_3860 [Frankineae bacterium MT45]|nr:hypothetical protein SAMN05444157_3860 [Frankineae bacterium MT45]